MAETSPRAVQDLTAVVHALLQQMQDKCQATSVQITGRIDDMSSRIDLPLEKSIADFMTQAGVEEIEGKTKYQPHVIVTDFVDHLKRTLENIFHKPRGEETDFLN